ncbi:hypothetical protein AAFC00_005917 [Neodothiora populina]|uniref:Ribosomal protein L9 domain-containing protein n=1 Tax=Neodothiora populina TaxID=2781224 RepID=A0ABR3P6B4_9PEZI
MSASLRPSIIPQCSSCARRFTKLGLSEWRPTSQQQIRGKKKMVNTGSTVTVRLLKDVDSFGRKGSYVPISVGQMRNAWFPQRVAEYVTDSQLKELKAKNISAERDFDFGAAKVAAAKASSSAAADANAQVSAQLRASRAAARTIETNRVTPTRSTELITILVPSRLDFYRQPIEAAPAPSTPATPQSQTSDQQQQPTKRSNSYTNRSISSAAADLLAARQQAASAPAPSKPNSSSSTATGAPIYGSVSTSDIANTIKSTLAQNDEASKITFSDDEVRFVHHSSTTAAAAGSNNNNPAAGGGAGAGADETEVNKVKHLGEYEVEIRIKGAGDVPAVRKHVRVLPLEKQDA